jgi:pimeloyl-ACP methyl ester carboxylesterase
VTEALIELDTGARLRYQRVGAGEPLLLPMGTAAQLGMWMPVEATLADRFDVVSFEYRGSATPSAATARSPWRR